MYFGGSLGVSIRAPSGTLDCLTATQSCARKGYIHGAGIILFPSLHSTMPSGTSAGLILITILSGRAVRRRIRSRVRRDLPRARVSPWRDVPCLLCGAVLPGRLGAAEIRIQGTGVVYAATNLVHHYVACHGYLPAPDFMDSVVKSQGRQAQPVSGTTRGIPEHLLVREP